jgi:hypothetical protein
MLNEIGNNYRQNGTGSVNSVRMNADSDSNALSALGYRLATLGVKGSKWLLTQQEPPKSVGIGGESSVVLNDTEARMTGIVQIPPCPDTHSSQKTCPAQFAAHQDSVGAKEHFKRWIIINCIITFNPFVVGSTPARPTIQTFKAPCTKLEGVFLRPCVISKTLLSAICLPRCSSSLLNASPATNKQKHNTAPHL